jgi:hypothetical protein
MVSVYMNAVVVTVTVCPPAPMLPLLVGELIGMMLSPSEVEVEIEDVAGFDDCWVAAGGWTEGMGIVMVETALVGLAIDILGKVIARDVEDVVVEEAWGIVTVCVLVTETMTTLGSEDEERDAEDAGVWVVTEVATMIVLVEEDEPPTSGKEVPGAPGGPDEPEGGDATTALLRVAEDAAAGPLFVAELVLAEAIPAD